MLKKMTDFVQYWRETDRKFENIMKEYDALTEARHYVHSMRERYVTGYEAGDYVWVFVCLMLWIALMFMIDFYIMM